MTATFARRTIRAEMQALAATPAETSIAAHNAGREWRCLPSRSADELEFIGYDPRGGSGRYHCRVDRGRMHGTVDTWLLAMNKPGRSKTPGFAVAVPSEFRGKPNRNFLDGRVRAVAIVAPGGRTVTLEFYRLRPPDELIDELAAYAARCNDASPETTGAGGAEETDHVRKFEPSAVPAERGSAAAEGPGGEHPEGLQGGAAVRRREADGEPGPGGLEGGEGRPGQLPRLTPAVDLFDGPEAMQNEGGR